MGISLPYISLCLTAGILIITTIYTYIVAVSLRHLRAQADAAVRSTEDNSWGMIVELFAGIDTLLFQNPELRPYFYDGQSIGRGHDDYRRVMTLAEMHVDIYDLVATNISNNEENDKSVWWASRDQWAEWVKDSLSSSPVLREFMSEILRNRSWYDERLMQWYNNWRNKGDKGIEPSPDRNAS